MFARFKRSVFKNFLVGVGLKKKQLYFKKGHKRSKPIKNIIYVSELFAVVYRILKNRVKFSFKFYKLNLYFPRFSFRKTRILNRFSGMFFPTRFLKKKN